MRFDTRFRGGIFPLRFAPQTKVRAPGGVPAIYLAPTPDAIEVLT